MRCSLPLTSLTSLSGGEPEVKSSLSHGHCIPSFLMCQQENYCGDDSGDDAQCGMKVIGFFKFIVKPLTFNKLGSSTC